jgi:hypothetical protein
VSPLSAIPAAVSYPLSASKTQTSGNQRFSVIADLKAAPAASAKTSTNGRYSVIADLAAPKSALAECGLVSPDIFKNGFEN